MNAKPISESAPFSRGARIAVFIGGLAAIAGGLAGIWFLFVQPLMNVGSARTWDSVDCHIISSQVKRHVDSEGDDSFSPDISYRYKVGNREYTSTRHSFYGGSGPRSFAQKAVDRFPAGSNASCFVDPDNPASATLNRDFSVWSLFALFFVLLVLLGAFFTWAALKGSWSIGKPKSPVLSAGMQVSGFGQSPAGIDWSQWEGPQKLKPESTRKARAIGLAIFALIWNGIVSVFLVALIGGAGGVCMGIFLIPFVGIGLFLIIACVHQFLSLFNPTVEIALSNGVIPVGEEVDVAWQLEGNVNRVRKLKIVIEGAESATYTRGTSTYTDTNVFETIPVVESSSSEDIRFGSATIRIPDSTIHSFDSAKNKITWSIKLEGDIPRWPDIKEVFQFKVKPL